MTPMPKSRTGLRLQSYESGSTARGKTAANGLLDNEIPFPRARQLDRGCMGGCLILRFLCVVLPGGFCPCWRTRTRTYINPNGTKASAVG